MRNNANNRQKVLKLCTCMAMKKVYSTVHSTCMLLPWRPFGVRSLPFVKQNSFIPSLSNNVYYSAQIRRFVYTCRYCISAVLIILLFKKEIEIKILVFQLKDSGFPAVSLETTYCTQWRTCAKFQHFLSVICRDIPHFVNFIQSL